MYPGTSGSVYDIIALDIERFKLVNEIYGRVSGDRMLKSLALTHILNTLREDGFYRNG